MRDRLALLLRQRALPLSAALALGSCGGDAPGVLQPVAPEPVAPIAGEAGPDTGTVLGLRPVTPATGAGNEWRSRAAATVLAVASPGGAFAGQPMEIVVRLDRTNRDTAVVQPNTAGLRAGDRVAVTWGERAQLSRTTRTRGAGAAAEGEPES
jgi:hypothetical protein